MSDRKLVLWVAWTAVLVTSPRLVNAQKVDVIHLTNGDRVTCEIKRLDRGVLTVSTDPLGTVTVHWGQVRGLESPREFDIQLASGAQYYGSLGLGPANDLMVTLTGGAPVRLALPDVIRLTPVGSTVWSRLDAALDTGFSFAQANLETRLTVNATVGYRGSRHEVTSTFASQSTTREDAERQFRSDFTLNGHRSLSNRWYTIGWGGFQQNDELSLDSRVVGGGGFGYDFVHTNYRLWSVYSGLAYMSERFFDEPSDQSAEAALGGQLDFFTPRNDRISITNRIVSYFNLSRSRVRLDLQSAWRHEIVKDFYWSLNGFDSFDGDPPAEQKKNDFGISLTLGYKF